MDSCTTQRLVFLSADPKRLDSWLAPDAAIGAVLRHTPEIPEIDLLCDQVVNRAGYDSPAIARLPLDGPDAALELAAAAVRQWIDTTLVQVVVVAESPECSPPALRQISLMRAAGLCVGVDLDRCRWVTGTGAWLAANGELRQLATLGTPRRATRDLAEVVSLVLNGEPSSPVAAWAARVLRGDTSAAEVDWKFPLQALYVQTALATTGAAEARL